MKDREITIFRKKTLLNNSHSWQIYIDDCFCDNIYGGEEKNMILMKIHIHYVSSFLIQILQELTKLK